MKSRPDMKMMRGSCIDRCAGKQVFGGTSVVDRSATSCHCLLPENLLNEVLISQILLIPGYPALSDSRRWRVLMEMEEKRLAET